MCPRGEVHAFVNRGGVVAGLLTKRLSGSSLFEVRRAVPAGSALGPPGAAADTDAMEHSFFYRIASCTAINFRIDYVRVFCQHPAHRKGVRGAELGGKIHLADPLTDAFPDDFLLQTGCSMQHQRDAQPLPDAIDPAGTEIHILYALKMGEKYRARYHRHFAHPVLHELDMQHEELLAVHPKEWVELIEDICRQK